MSEYLEAAIKAQQWERAKGELRAFVAMQGSYSSGGSGPKWDRWTDLAECAETFIASVEDEGLNE